ncbi:cuticle protein 16.8-like [Galendromus occidentalis]|uniref:Cuticle protein 16.8-like n=1 Tax=Galendromus occidentalis TaxID=34638 RepID=A0AAJ7L2S1_9ACAR|nr:cuticle protein 16.8-like [Galendromus occidentalis]
MWKLLILGVLTSLVAVDAQRYRHAYRRRIGFQRPETLAYASTIRDGGSDSLYPPQPYQFGFNTVDEFGTKMTRHEESDAQNRKKGSYSFTDAYGITRRVDYVADEHGFRATVNTNEPGTAPSQPASTIINAPAQPALRAASSYLAPVQRAPAGIYRTPYRRQRAYRGYYHLS